MTEAVAMQRFTVLASAFANASRPAHALSSSATMGGEPVSQVGAFLGQPQVSSLPDKELHAQLRLEPVERLREGGLRY